MNQEFFARIAEVLGNRGLRDSEIKAIFSVKKIKAFRINRLKTNLAEAEHLIKQLEKQINCHFQQLDWFKDAYLYDAQFTEQVKSSQLFTDGLIYIQNPSSYLPVLALDPKASDSYLDTCAAPGGKASLFASLAGSSNDMTLIDNNTVRIDNNLMDVINKMGIENANVLLGDAVTIMQQKLANQLYDKILVDADCSTEGLINFLSKEPLKFWSLGKINYFSQLQLAILNEAFKHLKQDGRLVYSTCTLAPEEDELIISKFLDNNANAKIIKLNFSAEKSMEILDKWQYQNIRPEVQGAIKIHPDSAYMEGFFVCLITKTSNLTNVVKLG